MKERFLNCLFFMLSFSIVFLAKHSLLVRVQLSPPAVVWRVTTPVFSFSGLIVSVQPEHHTLSVPFVRTIPRVWLYVPLMTLITLHVFSYRNFYGLRDVIQCPVHSATCVLALRWCHRTYVLWLTLLPLLISDTQRGWTGVAAFPSSWSSFIA